MQNADQCQSLDHRLAYTFAIRCFLKHQSFVGFIGNECILPVLFTLYDLLNDDDEYIRVLAAEAVAFVTKKSSAPLAAAEEFLDWLTREYNNSVIFAHNSVFRMASDDVLLSPGRPLPLWNIQGAFAKFMEMDNALFVEESQNLWLDGHRECVRWARILRTLYRSSNCIYSKSDEGYLWASPLDQLTGYAVQGIEVLTNILSTEVTQSWDSTPAVYCLCAGIFTSAHEVLAHLADKSSREKKWQIPDGTTNLLVQLRRFMDKADLSILHPQVLYQLLGREPLAENKLDVLLPQQVKLIVSQYPYLGGPQVLFCHSLPSGRQASDVTRQTVDITK